MNAPDGMKRIYTEVIDERGNRKTVSAVTVDPKKCSRCGEAIRENCYFVRRAVPGAGACWECIAQASDWERFQLERGQAGLNYWLKEQEAKRADYAARKSIGGDDEP